MEEAKKLMECAGGEAPDLFVFSSIDDLAALWDCAPEEVLASAAEGVSVTVDDDGTVYVRRTE